MPAAQASFRVTVRRRVAGGLDQGEPLPAALAFQVGNLKGTACDFKLTANFKLAADFVVTVPDFKFSWARVPQEPESSHVRANAGADSDDAAVRRHGENAMM